MKLALIIAILCLPLTGDIFVPTKDPLKVCHGACFSHRGVKAYWNKLVDNLIICNCRDKKGFFVKNDRIFEIQSSIKVKK